MASGGRTLGDEEGIGNALEGATPMYIGGGLVTLLLIILLLILIF